MRIWVKFSFMLLVHLILVICFQAIQVSVFSLACTLTTECAIPPFNGDSMIPAGVHIDLNYVAESRLHAIILAHIIDADLYEVFRLD